MLNLLLIYIKLAMPANLDRIKINFSLVKLVNPNLLLIYIKLAMPASLDRLLVNPVPALYQSDVPIHNRLA